MRQTQKRAAGFTLIELLVVVAIIALLISILLPSLARARELSKRTVCAANVKGIGNGFAAYATGNADDYPIPAHLTPTSAQATSGNTAVQYEQSIGYSRGIGGTAPVPDDGETLETDTQMSTTRAFWYLVRSGSSSPKSFICPSSEDTAAPDDNPQNYWDFGGPAPTSTNPSSNVPKGTALNQADWQRGWGQISYGYQVPFGKIGKPNPNVDQDMAVVADKGPFGAVLDGGKPMPTNFYNWNGGNYDSNGPNSTSSPDDWRKWNSPNHGGFGDGEGQNVLYPDAHADFFMNPLAGVAKDNIYTTWGVADGPLYSDRAWGRKPGQTNGTSSTKFAPWGNTDNLVYP